MDRDSENAAIAKFLRTMLAVVEKDEWRFIEERVREGKSVLDSHAKGGKYESLFINLAASQGLHASIAKSGEVFDAICNGMRVQIKSTDEGKISSQRMRRGKDDSRQYRVDEFEVFVGFRSRDYWIWPVTSIEDCRNPGFVRSTLYPDEWPTFRENWGIFNESTTVPSQRQKSLSLD